MLDTEGEPYMQLPDEDMSFFVRNSLDVIAAYVAIAFSSLLVGVYVAWLIVGNALCKLKGLSGYHKKLV